MSFLRRDGVIIHFVILNVAFRQLVTLSGAEGSRLPQDKLWESVIPALLVIPAKAGI
jgi:hypothetical protein